MDSKETFEECVRNIPSHIMKSGDINWYIGDDVYLTLLRQGLNISEAANQLGISTDMVREYISNQHDFTVSEIYNIQEKLGINLIKYFK